MPAQRPAGHGIPGGACGPVPGRHRHLDAALQNHGPENAIPERMKKYLLTLLLLAIGTAGLYPDNDAAEIYLKKAQELAKKKDYKEALSNFNKAVNEAPELPAVYLALGELYRELNESQEASANFRKALELIEQQGGQDRLKSVQNKIN